MKRAIVCAALAIFSLGMVPANAQGETKIGVVDLTRVITEYWRFKKATNELQDEAAKAQKEINERLELRRKLGEELNKLKGQIEDPIVSEQVRNKKRQEFTEKMQEIQALERDTQEFRFRRQQQLNDRRSRMFNGIREEVLSVIKTKAEGEKYQFVIEKSALGLTPVQGLAVPLMIYSAGGIDLSDEIIVELNKDAPAEEAAPAPAPAGDGG